MRFFTPSGVRSASNQMLEMDVRLFSLACSPHKPATCKDSGNLADNKLIKKVDESCHLNGQSSSTLVPIAMQSSLEFSKVYKCMDLDVKETPWSY